MHQSEDDDGDLDEGELEILREAGVIAGPSKVGHKRRSSRPQAKHIVFVENEQEGMYERSLLVRHMALYHAAQQYVTKRNNLQTSRPESRNNVGAIDLGWREPEKQKGRKKKDNVVGASDSTDVSEGREAAKVCFPYARLDIFIFSGNSGASNTSVKGAVRAVTSGPYVAICRTGVRNAEDDDGKGTL